MCASNSNPETWANRSLEGYGLTPQVQLWTEHSEDEDKAWSHVCHACLSTLNADSQSLDETPQYVQWNITEVIGSANEEQVSF